VGLNRGVRVDMDYQRLPVDQSDVWYRHGPDSIPQPGVPRGSTTEMGWSQSTIYAGTTRRFWVHVPSAYDSSRAANVAVFQDGWWYLDPDGQVRGGIVLDNLVHRGQIPVTIGIFVNPGARTGAEHSTQRNVEYDAFDDRYAAFLMTEILPEVASRWSLHDDPGRRLIAGGSSGGTCAFTAAWHRPDWFGHVFCSLSSFVQMPGGNPYPALTPVTPRKPVRIFMHAGHRDLQWNEQHENWLAENLRVATALAEAGYDFRLLLGDGGHTPNHTGVLLPDALRWHWLSQVDRSGSKKPDESPVA